MPESLSPPGVWAPRTVGPGSLLWRYAGDRRIAFTGLSTGILQLMHPAIGAGVVDHSEFFEDPWARILRSLPQILGVIYAPDPQGVALRVRALHRRIRGSDHHGHAYEALDPPTFWWAHATFQRSTEMVVDRFDRHRLSEAEREELYLDGVEWYRRYGVSTDPVPASRAAFGAEWDRHIEEVLEMTPAAAKAVEMALQGSRDQVPFLPDWTRPLQPVLVGPALRLSAIGGLPEEIRRRFGIAWSASDEARYRALQLLVRRVWPHLPAGVRIAAPARPEFWASR